jgi:hypothetical protein
MTKRELIDAILGFNTSADAGFLAQFSDRELAEYLEALRLARAAHAKSSPQRRAGGLASFNRDIPPCHAVAGASEPVAACGSEPARAGAISVKLSDTDFAVQGQQRLF